MMSKTENPKTGTRDLPSALRLRLEEGLGTWKKRKSAVGFTLVELLVVISIISLLVAILLPTLSNARKEAANVRTIARITDLSGGCIAYRDANDYYPGQEYAGELKGSTTPGNFTGSQWLARSLFTDSTANPVYPNSNYASVKPAEDLIGPEYGGYHTISDRNTTVREILPILYYPARPGISGVAQYKTGDNSEYTTGHVESTSFADFIKDNRFGQPDTPYNPGAFLLIAAGRDRLYFTDDDLCYPAFKSN